VRTFPTTREAKEFLVSKIVMQSQLEGIPLSDVERKMLYFSETGWTLPDIDEVSDVFDRDYDQALYEQKIGAFARNFCTKARKDNHDEFEAWNEAARTLRREDHYLLVLIDALASDRFSKQLDTPSPSRFLKLSVVAFVLACVVLVISYLFLRN
jgi:hypothetical protein